LVQTGGRKRFGKLPFSGSWGATWLAKMAGITSTINNIATGMYGNR
jgi:hypothetical protein